MNFSAVPASQIAGVWGQVEPLIRQCADRSQDYTPEDIAKRLLKQTAQLWVAHDDRIVMACVTEIAGGECNILTCAGSDMAGWIGFLDHIKDWARAEGCRKMTLVGREGWRRVLTDWKMTAVVMEFDL